MKRDRVKPRGGGNTPKKKEALIASKIRKRKEKSTEREKGSRGREAENQKVKWGVNGLMSLHTGN